MTYNENLALEWMAEVERLMSWNLPPDCEGTPEQRLQSAWINTQDSYAEKVVSIVDQPKYLRDHDFVIDDPDTLALLPPLPDFE